MCLPMVEYSLDRVELEDVLFPVRVFGSTWGNGFVMYRQFAFRRDWRDKEGTLWLLKGDFSLSNGTIRFIDICADPGLQ
jgi:hypothetical protein